MGMLLLSGHDDTIRRGNILRMISLDGWYYYTSGIIRQAILSDKRAIPRGKD